MTTTAIAQRLAWHDRWTTPKESDLLDCLKFHHKRNLVKIMESLDSVEDVERSLIWYGPSWKWTFQYTQVMLRIATRLRNPSPSSFRAGQQSGDGRGDSLCYVVPDCIMPLVCVPLRTQMIETLPMKRLSRFIRDGIRTAKCAVEIHWAIWTPISETETGMILELIRRKREFNLAPAKAAITPALVN
jgi:hypothetical protein